MIYSFERFFSLWGEVNCTRAKVEMENGQQFIIVGSVKGHAWTSGATKKIFSLEVMFKKHEMEVTEERMRLRDQLGKQWKTSCIRLFVRTQIKSGGSVNGKEKNLREWVALIITPDLLKGRNNFT